MYYPPAGPPALTGGGSGKRIAWILGGVLLIAVIVGVLGMTGVIFGVGPKESVERAHDAYDKRDLATFDKYFDSESVLRDMLDQMPPGRSANDEVTQVRAHLPEIANALKRAMFDLPPPDQTPEVHKLTDGPSDALKRAMKKTAYKGIASESRTGPDAMVGVKWGDATSQSPAPETLDVKLRKSGNHWKVVAIPNLTKVTK